MPLEWVRVLIEEENMWREEKKAIINRDGVSNIQIIFAHLFIKQLPKMRSKFIRNKNMLRRQNKQSAKSSPLYSFD
jgi:hypothetical protein